MGVICKMDRFTNKPLSHEVPQDVVDSTQMSRTRAPLRLEIHSLDGPNRSVAGDGDRSRARSVRRRRNRPLRQCPHLERSGGDQVGWLRTSTSKPPRLAVIHHTHGVLTDHLRATSEYSASSSVIITIAHDCPFAAAIWPANRFSSAVHSVICRSRTALRRTSLSCVFLVGFRINDFAKGRQQALRMALLH